MQRIILARRQCQWHHLQRKKNRGSGKGVTVGSFSTASNNTARVEAAKSYLEAWVGSNNSNNGLDRNNNVSSSSPRHRAVAMANLRASPMMLSSSSYLLATLRLEKLDTLESIAARLQQQQEHSDDQNNYHKQWKCPVVLDLRAWCPDGSPHYQPPPVGSLIELSSLLDRYGLTIVGVNGLPKELQPEATEDLGLPSLFLSSSGKSGSSSNGSPPGGSPNYLQLQDVIQMVARRQAQEEPIECISSQPSHGNHNEEEETNLSHQIPTSTSNRTDLFPKAKDSSVEEEEPQQQPLEEILSMPPISPAATIYHGNVRSGQQVSSEKGHSLVILGSVNSGGEVLSDGDIMVFGKLRGKALAGLALPTMMTTTDNNHKKAVIIATSMDPELICIGSVLSTVDTVQDFGIPSGTPAMVSLKRDRSSGSDKVELVFEPISMT